MTDDVTPIRAFGESDGDLGHLDGRSIAIVGYGNQGRAQALNLRDSLRRAQPSHGVRDILVATLKDGSWEQAEQDGFSPRPLPEVAEAADILFLLIPDEDLPPVFAAEIAPHLQKGDALVVASGYNLAFGELTVPPDVDVLMLAPRMIGRQLRELYERGEGFYSYVSVEQDASGRAWPTLLALAKGIGCLRLGALELSAKDEAVLDLFHEQGLGSLLGSMIFLMLEVGVEAGLPPEAMVLDLYISGEMAETFQAMAELGFVDQSRLHSLTSQYGGMMRTIGMDREPMRKHLVKIIEEIRDGSFAKQWAAERAAKYENFEKLRALGRERNPFTPIEERLRVVLREAQERGGEKSK